MLVAHRYLNRELVAVLVVVFVLVLFVGLGGRLIGYLQQAALGKYSAESLLILVGLRLPEFAQLALPFALFVAVMLTLGRLYAEQEAAVLSSAGVGPVRLFVWSLPVVLAVTGLVALTSLWLTPTSNHEFSERVLEQRLNREFDGLNPGVFQIFSDGQRVSYMEQVDTDARTLTGVFMAEIDDDGQRTSTIWAKRGSQYVDEGTGSRFLALRDGRRYEGTAGSPDYRVLEFDSLAQRIEIQTARLFKVKADETATAELLGHADPDFPAELHWRLSLPLFALIGAGLAFGLARVKPRQGRFARIAPGVLILVLYYLLLVLNLNALKDEQIPMAAGLWLVHLAFAGFAVFLLRRAQAPARV